MISNIGIPGLILLIIILGLGFFVFLKNGKPVRFSLLFFIKNDEKRMTTISPLGGHKGDIIGLLIAPQSGYSGLKVEPQGGHLWNFHDIIKTLGFA